MTMVIFVNKLIELKYLMNFFVINDLKKHEYDSWMKNF